MFDIAFTGIPPPPRVGIIIMLKFLQIKYTLSSTAEIIFESGIFRLTIDTSHYVNPALRIIIQSILHIVTLL